MWIVLLLYAFKLVIKPLYEIANTILKDSSNNNESFKNVKNFININQIPNISSGLNKINFFNNDNCSKNGLFLGPDDVPFDCNEICKSSNFKYKFLQDDSMIINNAFLSKRGGYCLPQEALRCNNYTSRIVKTLNSWKCLPKGKLFGGEDGCKIIGCNGFIKDNLTGIYYSDTIPLTLAMSKPESETVPYEHVYGTPGGNLYRFQCTDTEIDIKTGNPTPQAKLAVVKDFMNNKLIESEYSRFDRIRNACASQIFNASEVIMPNFQMGTCTCLSQSSNDDSNIQQYINGIPTANERKHCSPCISGWSRKNNFTNVGIVCRKSFDDTYIGIHRFIIPCGIHTFDSNTAACMNAKIYISKGLSAFSRKIFNSSKQN